MGREKDGIDAEMAELERLIGKRLYVLRVDYGLTQKAIGAFIGVSAQAASRYEGGDGLTVGKLYKIARSMKVPISSFFPQQGSALSMEITMKTEIEFLHHLRKMDRPPQRILLELMREINSSRGDDPDSSEDQFDLIA